MRFNVLSCHRDALSRLLQEAVLIDSCANMNSKGEWRLNKRKRLTIELTEWEKNKREKEEAKEEEMMSEQIEKVKCLLKMNETSNESNLELISNTEKKKADLNQVYLMQKYQ